MQLSCLISKTLILKTERFRSLELTSEMICSHNANRLRNESQAT